MQLIESGIFFGNISHLEHVSSIYTRSVHSELRLCVKNLSGKWFRLVKTPDVATSVLAT